MAQAQPENISYITSISPHERWIQSTGVPIHRAYFIDDARTVEVGPWPERECNAAFLQLRGNEGVVEVRVTEIPAGKTLPPLKCALDDAVYVVDGRGLTTIWSGDGGQKKTFEWQKHSLFLLPHGCTYQLTNPQGDKPVRLLHQNYLPLAMQTIADPDFFFNNPYEAPEVLYGSENEFYADARAVTVSDPRHGGPALNYKGGAERQVWYGNFFPDLRAWDKLVPFWGRGAGGHVIHVQFPGSENTAHMSVFPPQTYKKGHRHGPGVVIIIPVGEGYSIMWPEGEEKIFVPWHEGSVFVPPNRWFHQHFNLGTVPARYLAFHSPRMSMMISGGERLQNAARDQIEYVDEDPWVRQTFAAELAKKGLTSVMPEEAYQNKDYEWDYQAGQG